MRLRNTHIMLLACLFIVVGCTPASRVARREYTDKPLVYPKTPKVDQFDDFHGLKVADPYRWLEDLDSLVTAGWIEAQNEVTFNYLNKIPVRSKINKRLTELWDYEKYSMPFKEGGRYFYFKNDGLQNQYVLYTTDSPEHEGNVLLDPNKWSDDGTVSLKSKRLGISENGKLIAYAVSTSGSDWQEWRVRDIETGKDLEDRLKWSKFSKASWTHDHRGFFYSRYDEPKEGEELKEQNYFQKLYYHEIATPQSEDVLVYERPDHKDWGLFGHVTEDGKYLIISVWHGDDDNNLVFYKDLSAENAPMIELINDFEAQYGFIASDGPIFWFRTDLEAPQYRVIAIDTRHPAKYNWKEVIPQAKETLRSVGLVNDMFTAKYMKDVHSVIKIYGIEGSFIRDVELPGIGSALGFRGKRKDVETFYGFTSFTYPYTIYRYDMQTGKSELFRKPDVDFKPDNYVSRQVFYHSKDGTRIPMFITHKKGLKLDGNNPTLLYGYGGFNASKTPSFSVTKLAWMEMGGVYAMANLRGGGEYGQEWHEAGMKLNKQNVFDDFIAAAEWLIDNKYTNSKKLAISGGSNGGLLVGACMTQRPELFAAALPNKSVMDMLRFHKFTIGWAWVSDYGSPDDPEEFKALYAYSPLHNFKPGTNYPATLITVADHDDRVFPGHSFKFAAALQEAHRGPNPVLIRIETKAGHGAGKPTTKRIEEATDRYAFLVRVLGMQVE